MHSKTLIKTFFMGLLALGLLTGCGSNAFQDPEGAGSSVPQAPTVVVPTSTNNTSPEITGTCISGNTVELTIAGSVIAPTAVCTAGGTYSITPSTPLTVGGPYDVTATQTTADGVMSPASNPEQITIVSFSFTSTPPVVSVEECKPVDANYTSSIANATGSVTYSLSGADAADFNVSATGIVTFIGATPDFETKPSYTYDLNANDGATTITQTGTVTITDFSVTHNGTLYGCVTNETTKEVWIDRNLGAAQICTLFNDVGCYGDYYQWGREFDGHEDSMSGTTTTKSATIDTTTTNNPLFIRKTGGGSASFDWTSDYNAASKTARITNWSKTDGTSVCPVGFRVPTLAEFQAETATWTPQSTVGAFASTLKLPAAGGGRHYQSGGMQLVGTKGNYWIAENRDDNRGRVVKITAGGVSNTNLTSLYMTWGISVRCIKD